MEHVSIGPKLTSDDLVHPDADWPKLTIRARVTATFRNICVTLGWRLHNIGLKKIGLRLVNLSHAGAGASG